jgi:hypothetical protein
MNDLKRFLKSKSEKNLHPFIDELDTDDLNYISGLINELDQSGREHMIRNMKRDHEKIDIEASYKVTYIRKG